MYLYEKQEDKVEIYSLFPNMDKVFNYRKDYIELIPEEERMFKAVGRNNMALCSGKMIDFNGFSHNSITTITSDKLNKNSSWLTGNHHHLLTYDRVGCEIKRQEQIIDKFCSGKIKSIGMVLVTDKKVRDYVKYLIMTSYYYVRNDQESTMSNIISIPKELFSLEWCMFGGNMDALDDNEFSKVVKLFDFSIEPVDIFSYEDVIKYRDYGLIDDRSETIISRIEDFSLKSEKTLTRVRKYR